ncbi:MAG: hypothetical protein AB1555_01230 [Nitrospirota bacterium]
MLHDLARGLLSAADFRYKRGTVGTARRITKLSGHGGRLAAGLPALVCLATLLAGCGLFAGRDGFTSGYWLPLTVRLSLDETVAHAALQYRDACGQPQTLPIDATLKAAVVRRIGTVFERVQVGDVASKRGAADGIVTVVLGISQTELYIPRKVRRSYPVTVTLGLDFSYTDEDGAVLYSKKLQSFGRGEVETDGESCEVHGLDKIAEQAIEKVTEGMAKQLGTATKIREAALRGKNPGAALPRAQASTPVQAGDQVPAKTAPPPSEPGSSPVQSEGGQRPKLTFRAIVRDENRNQVLENHEEVNIEIEVKNEGPGPALGVDTLLGGSPSLIGRFPNPIEVGDLQAGELKRVTASAKLDGVKEVEQAELILSLRTLSSGAHLPLPKKFLIAVRPDQNEEVEVLSVDVDQLPKPGTGFKQPKAIGIAIGVETFRDAGMPDVKFAGRDAQVMAGHLRTLAGIPASRLKLLVNEQAMKDDLAEVFEEWLPPHTEPGTVAYVYFAGRALVEPVTGAVSLVPYDGVAVSRSRLFSLRRLLDALSRASVQRAVVMLEVSLEPVPGADPGSGIEPMWDGEEPASREDKLMFMIGNRTLQEAHAYEQGRHGLFTYYLLKGLRGEADMDKNGVVQVGELCAYVRAQVRSVAKKQDGNDQEPICIPGAGQGSALRILPFTKVR